MENEFLKYLSFAHYLADRAGSIIFKFYKSNKLILSNKKSKEKKELITNADLIIEKEITKLITMHYPEHNIIGEELGNKKKLSDFTWIIDPIDGTKAYATGIPVFGFLLALKYKEQFLLGLVDQPVIKERFWNNLESSFMNGNKIKTSKCKKIKEAFVASTDPNMFKNFNELNNVIFKKFNFVRWGTDVLGYLRCAEGKLDAVIERDIKIWDIAALEPIVRLAGGIITTWDGKSIGTNDTVLAANNLSLHGLLLNKLQKFI